MSKNVDSSNLVIGRNPAMETLTAMEEGKAQRNLEKIYVQKGATGSLAKIQGKAKALGVPIYFSEKAELDGIITKEIGEARNHQGVIGIMSNFKYCSVDDILKVAKDRGEDPFVMLLDGIEDPHNLGAIIRTAECAGVHGIIIPKRRAVGINETVSKTSAGAVEYMKCARVTNIGNTIAELQSQGLWVGALDMDGETLTKSNLTGPLAVVVGGEGRGVTKLVKEKSDFVISLPMRGKINSLNASNAAAVLMYEVRRQRDK